MESLAIQDKAPAVFMNCDPMEEYPVDGRELHERLGIETPYLKWFSRMREYGFEAGKDFQEVLDKIVQNSLGGRPATDHRFTLSMAKEICMLQRTDQGREVRRYLLAIEEAWNKPEMVMARALKFANKNIEEAKAKIVCLEAKIEEQAPKVAFAEAVEKAEDNIHVADMARILNQKGFKIGQNQLFALLRAQSIFMSGRYNGEWNMPYQRYINEWYFVVQESCYFDSRYGYDRFSHTPLVTPKGQIWIANHIHEWLAK